MKNLLLASLALISVGSFANEIQGTLMLKGSLKTKINVNSVSTVCKIKVDKIKNYLQEDDFGNPGYEAKAEISLDGNDLDRKIKVRFSKEFTIINFHTLNGTHLVKDFDYVNEKEKVAVVIDEGGYIVSTTFPYGKQTINCKF